MKHAALEIFQGLAFAAPAVVAFIILAPLLCVRVDRQLGWQGFVPGWLQVFGVGPLVFGLAIAAWTLFLFAVDGHGTPNPIAPPRHLVRKGPYRWSRNPMMLAGWTAGIGLGLLFRSPVYIAFCLVLVCAGSVYVWKFEEPRLRARFGEAYDEYRRATPRWLGLRHS